MSLYGFLQLWLLPLCIPLGIGAVAAFVFKRRFVLFVPPVIALLCLPVTPPRRVYADFSPDATFWQIRRAHLDWEARRRRAIALSSGTIATVILCGLACRMNRVAHQGAGNQIKDESLPNGR